MSRNFKASIIFSAVDKASKVIRGIGDSTTKANAKIKRFAGNLQRKGIEMSAKITAPVSAGLYSVITPAMRLQSELLQINKIIESGPASMEKYRKSILRMSQETGLEFRQIGQTFYAGINAGIGRNKNGTYNQDLIKRYAEHSLMMNRAFDLQGDAGGDALSTFYAQQGNNLNKAIRVSDQLNTIANAMKARPSDMIYALSKSLSIAGMVGADSSVPVGMLGTMFSQGHLKETVATAFRNLFLKLLTAPTASKKVLGGFSKLGLDPKDVQKRMQNDPSAMIVEFLKRVKNQKNRAVIFDIIDKDASAPITSLIDHYEILQNNIALAKDEQKTLNSVYKEYKNVAQGAQFQTDRLGSGFAAFRAEIGKNLLPFYEKLLIGINSVMNAATQWMQKNPEISKTIITFTTVFAGIAATLGPLAIGIALVAKALVFLNIVALPFTWIFWAIAAGAAGLAVVVTYWDDIKAAMVDTWEWAKKIFADFKAWFASTWFGKGISMIASLGDSMGKAVQSGSSMRFGVPQQNLRAINQNNADKAKITSQIQNKLDVTINDERTTVKQNSEISVNDNLVSQQTNTRSKRNSSNAPMDIAL